MKYLHDLKKGIKALLKNSKAYRVANNVFLSEHFTEMPRRNIGNEVICVFDGTMHHGGIADRLRGICSIYQFCKNTGRIFKVFFVDPFDLKDYLIPNEYDWIISEEEISYSKELAKPIILNCDLNMFEGAIHRRFLFTEADRNKQLHIYSNTYCYDETFSQCYNELFKPSLLLQQAINEQKQLIGGKYISVSFRFCNLLGEHELDALNALSANEQLELMKKSKGIIHQLHQQYLDFPIVLVTSDSNKYIEFIQDLPYVYIIPGEICHSNYKATSASYLKTFLDFYLIAGAQHVFMARTAQMYKSGFARRASMINNAHFKEVNY